jgi:hypothetical protein
MATLDLEVLYLILTKAARREDFYSYLAAQAGPGQQPGTITAKELSAVYERIKGVRLGTRVNWRPHLDQLNLFLSHCGLPALGKVLRQEGGPEPSPEALAKVQGTQWPAFSALKNLYRKR